MLRQWFRSLGYTRQSAVIQTAGLLVCTIATIVVTVIVSRPKGDSEPVDGLVTATISRNMFRLPSKPSEHVISELQSMTHLLAFILRNEAGQDIHDITLVLPAEGIYELIDANGNSTLNEFKRRIPINVIRGLDTAIVHVWIKSEIPAGQDVFFLTPAGGKGVMRLPARTPSRNEFDWYRSAFLASLTTTTILAFGYIFLFRGYWRRRRPTNGPNLDGVSRAK